MPVERYEHARHYQDFSRWYAHHHEGTLEPGMLPKVGFVVPGVAMGFLYQTDSKIAFIEGLVANPETSGEQRTRGIDRVVLAIINEAKALGFEILHGQTDLPAVLERAKRMGFEHDEVPYFSVTLKL